MNGGSKSTERESMSGLGVAIYFMLLGPIIAFVPRYFGFSNWLVYPFLALAGLSILIAVVGGLIELGKLGLLRGLSTGPMAENVGIAVLFGLVAGAFHLGGTYIEVSVLTTAFKIFAVVGAALATMFVAVVLGDILQERVAQGGSGNRGKGKSTAKNLGAFFVWLASLAATLIQSVFLLSELIRR